MSEGSRFAGLSRFFKIQMFLYHHYLNSEKNRTPPKAGCTPVQVFQQALKVNTPDFSLQVIFQRPLKNELSAPESDT